MTNQHIFSVMVFTCLARPLLSPSDMLMSMLLKVHIAVFSPDTDLTNDRDDVLFFQEHFRMNNITFFRCVILSTMMLISKFWIGTNHSLKFWILKMLEYMQIKKCKGIVSRQLP